MRRLKVAPTFLESVLLGSLTAVTMSCGAGNYADISTPNGRRILIDQANNYLTANDCQEAINTLKPLYESPHVDNEVRLIYSSAYACKGGLNFPNLLSALRSGSGDIWAQIVRSNYSSTNADGHIAALKTASDILRQTGNPANVFSAGARTSEVNLYMVLVQANILASVISPLGAASRSTGKKTQAICASCSTTDQCNAEVAFAAVKDALNNTTTGNALGSIQTTMTGLCNTLGAACPTNQDPGVCTVVEQTQGQAILDAINTQWGF